MKIVRSLAGAAQTLLSLACWLTPGPRCPRILLAVLGAVALAGCLGAAFYAFGS